MKTQESLLDNAARSDSDRCMFQSQLGDLKGFSSVKWSNNSTCLLRSLQVLMALVT